MATNGSVGNDSGKGKGKGKGKGTPPKTLTLTRVTPEQAKAQAARIFARFQALAAEAQAVADSEGSATG